MSHLKDCYNSFDHVILRSDHIHYDLKVIKNYMIELNEINKDYVKNLNRLNMSMNMSNIKTESSNLIVSSLKLMIDNVINSYNNDSKIYENEIIPILKRTKDENTIKFNTMFATHTKVRKDVKHLVVDHNKIREKYVESGNALEAAIIAHENAKKEDSTVLVREKLKKTVRKLMAEYDKNNDAYLNITKEVNAAQKLFDITQAMLMDDFEKLDINRSMMCKEQYSKIQVMYKNQGQNYSKIAETMEIIAKKFDPVKDVENWFIPLLPTEKAASHIEYRPEPFKIIEIAKREAMPRPDSLSSATALPLENPIVTKRGSFGEISRAVGKLSNLPPPPRMPGHKVQQSQIFTLPRLADLEELKSEDDAIPLTTPKSHNRKYSILGLNKNKSDSDNENPPVLGPRLTRTASPLPQIISPAKSLPIIDELQDDDENVIAIGISLYNWNGEEVDDLPLYAGAKVELLAKSDDNWWRGRCDGNVGNFPFNYCTFEFAENLSDELKMNSSRNGSDIQPCQKIYKVLYDFDAENPEELTVREGDILHVRGEFTDWIVGNLPDYPADSGGLVPRAYCELLA